MQELRETLKVKKERAILVAAILPGSYHQDNLNELTALAETAGAIVVYWFKHKLRTIHPGTYIGKGKIEQLAQCVKRLKADVVIFDNDLSPGQIRGLEKAISTKVIDRSELILDIFATRAKTTQAKLQVELAQLEYTYPRLTRMWTHLDTVAGAGGATAAGTVGGIGTRGPGEQQLEIDRRLVQKRITELKRNLENIDNRRIREINAREGMFKICIVGYTNAGKSTLLNKLTNAGVLVEDRLFATLDTRTRKWSPAKGVEVVISDTVGFVRNLPHQLVASFKATLEEAVNADLLIHVIDASNPDALSQIESVDNVLSEIGCAKKPILQVLNKIDVVRKISDLEILQTILTDAISISAKTGLGLDALRQAVINRYRGSELLLRVTAPYSDGKIHNYLQAHGSIINRQFNDDHVLIEARLGQNQLLGLQKLHPQNIEILKG